MFCKLESTKCYGIAPRQLPVCDFDRQCDVVQCRAGPDIVCTGSEHLFLVNSSLTQSLPEGLGKVIHKQGLRVSFLARVCKLRSFSRTPRRMCTRSPWHPSIGHLEYHDTGVAAIEDFSWEGTVGNAILGTKVPGPTKIEMVHCFFLQDLS